MDIGRYFPPGALKPDPRSDEIMFHRCGSHRYGHMFCGAPLGGDAMNQSFVCADCWEKWDVWRPLCKACRITRPDMRMTCPPGACPYQKWRVSLPRELHWASYENRDRVEKLHCWWRRHPCATRTERIDKILATFDWFVYQIRQEAQETHQRGLIGQGQATFMGGLFFEHIDATTVRSIGRTPPHQLYGRPSIANTGPYTYGHD